MRVDPITTIDLSNVDINELASELEIRFAQKMEDHYLSINEENLYRALSYYISDPNGTSSM